MQKRRSAAGDSATLPMTEADVVAAKSTTRRRVRKRRLRKRKGNTLLRIYGPPVCAVAVVVVMIMLGTFVLQSFLAPREAEPEEMVEAGIEPKAFMDDDPALEKFPLSHFPTLTYALENADLVALYFAASWCPMSTPVTEKLEEAFSHDPEILLPPEADNSKNEKFPLAIVYVSSDDSKEEMEKYSKKNWIDVPFDSEDRTELKKHFQVCAKKELPILDIDRKSEIPTLIVLDAKTHGVLTTDGVMDLESLGAGALKQWQGMEHVFRGLEDKYID